MNKLGKTCSRVFSVSSFRSFCYTFLRRRIFSAGEIFFPHFHKKRGRGRTGYDLDIHVTRRGDLHGLQPERYVRFPFVRNVSRVGIFGFFVLFVLLVLLTRAESGGSVQGA